MKKQTKLIAAAVALVVVIAIFIGVYNVTRPATSEGGKTITVYVVHSDESSVTFTYTTDEEYLGAVLVNEGLVEGEDSDYGLYITTVDGETADYSVDCSYWALYEGDEYAMQGADSTTISDGDEFSLIYTIYG